MSSTKELSIDGKRPAKELPAWHPAWAKQLAELYFSGTTSLFIVHGNVHDLVSLEEGDDGAYGSVTDFLATQVFGRWDLVLGYDLGRGLRALAGSSPERLREMMQYLTARWGDPASWPRDPEKVLLLLDAFSSANSSRNRPTANASRFCSSMPSTSCPPATSTRWRAARQHASSAF